MTYSAHIVFSRIAILLTISFVASCISQPILQVGEQVKPSQEAASVKTEVFEVEDKNFEGWKLNEIERELIVEPPDISINNISNITFEKKFYPYYPEIVSISGNQKVIAAGDLSGVRIFDTESGEIIMEIDVDLPDCLFGADAYLHLDYSGNYLAVTTLTGVEVWQIGGGIIYRSPYLHGRTLDRLVCGMDVPQLAISPNGRLLAESGMTIEEYGFESYFRVIDILNNEIVYNWNGSLETLHGHLSTLQNTGFSADGSVLHTFDSTQFNITGEDLHNAFDYWSTETWKSLKNDSNEVRKSFPIGERYFAINRENAILIFSKDNGNLITEIGAETCVWDYPCTTAFSPDGLKIAILYPSEKMNYKRESLITNISVFDIGSAKEIKGYQTLVRNKNSVGLKNDGTLIVWKTDLDEGPKWWTNTSYLSGFHKFDETTIAFTPQVTDISDNQPIYTGSCLINIQSQEIECVEGIYQDSQTILFVDLLNDAFNLYEGANVIVQVKYPAGSGLDEWQVRIKAYHAETGVGYFCLDRNFREETCVVMDFDKNQIINERIDLYGFNSSPELDKVVFIDREEKELLLFDEKTGKIKPMKSYQAVSCPVKPAVLSGGKELLYFVQSLDNKQIFIEKIALEEGKVIKRYGFEGFEEIVPSAIAVNPANDVWVIGDTNGNIYFTDPGTETIVRELRTSSSVIVDLSFSPDGKWLFSMDQAGVITSWHTE